MGWRDTHWATVAFILSMYVVTFGYPPPSARYMTPPVTRSCPSSSSLISLSTVTKNPYGPPLTAFPWPLIALMSPLQKKAPPAPPLYRTMQRWYGSPPFASRWPLVFPIHIAPFQCSFWPPASHSLTDASVVPGMWIVLLSQLYPIPTSLSGWIPSPHTDSRPPHLSVLYSSPCSWSSAPSSDAWLAAPPPCALCTCRIGASDHSSPTAHQSLSRNLFFHCHERFLFYANPFEFDFGRT